MAVTGAGGAVGFTPPVTAAEVAPVADAALDRAAAGDAHLVVAQADDGTVVGLAFLEPRKPGTIFGHVAVMRRLQVRPDHQGRGLGSRIAAAVHATARRDGRELVQITARGGTGVEQFYAQLGYELVARIPGIIRVAPGDDRDELVLLHRL